MNEKLSGLNSMLEKGGKYPERWADREFREPTDNYILRNKNEEPFKSQHIKGFLPIEKAFKKHVEDTILPKLQEARENTFGFEKEFGTEFLEKMNAVYNWVIEYFQGKGFDVKTLPEAYLMEGKDKEAGHSTSSHIEIKYFDLIENKELKEIETLSILAHELYHTTSQRVMEFFSKNSQGTIGAHPDTAYGASYNLPDKEGPKALEEGLACIFQDTMLKKIKTLFKSEDIKIYEDLQLTFLNKVKELGYKMKRFQTSKFKIVGDQIDYSFTGASTYDTSTEMVEYIASQIPNFDILVEKARLERHTLDLARAIEKRFGKGSYRLVTSATTEEAESVLSKLKVSDKN